jgi:hypothetical protein
MMRQTNEQRVMLQALQASAGRWRVEADDEGWPVIHGNGGRIEYHDGHTLAVYIETSRLDSRMLRLIKAGCRRHQTGDGEARLLFDAVRLDAIAKLIRARYRTARTAYQGGSAEHMRAMRAMGAVRRSRTIDLEHDSRLRNPQDGPTHAR